jgi:hypothetical protein
LAADERALPASAYSLGQDLFGRHQGPRELASQRKQALADVAAQRHQRRGR